MLISRQRQYTKRFKRVLKFIDEHLDESIDLNQLAKVANFSKCHFQRQFSEYLGMSAFHYIGQLRLQRSAYELAFRQHTICDIAFNSHFQSQEAFSRAFKKCFGQSPLKFRRATPWQTWHLASSAIQIRNRFMHATFTLDHVEITQFPSTDIALLAHHGNPALVMKTVSQFIQWRKVQGNLSPSVSDTFNILHHDPQTVTSSEYRFDVACAVTHPITDNDVGVVNDKIMSCRCAMIRCVGSNEDMNQAIQFLYGHWLPQSNEACLERPLFVKRVFMYPEVAMHEQEFEIYLPLV